MAEINTEYVKEHGIKIVRRLTGGRVIDLSRGAAAIISVFQSGVAPVVLEVLGR